ncbi:hypothetical protein [Brevundimonas sp. NIBR11]|nr:hypothetical protein [Brevundimonas sp. NIBR11]
MAHQTAASVGIDEDRPARRWSSRLGYGLAIGGSAATWAALVAAIVILT